jgi:quinol monooxygenase YgiN
MLIIAGHLLVDPEARAAYLAECEDVVRAARAAPGCFDFALTADTVEPDMIRVFERWENEAQLLAFRGSGPSDDQQVAIRGAEVARYTISEVGEP